MAEKFDAIVVGAGPAGVTAAYVMAKNKINVAIIERGEYPGSKNVIGGVLYIKTLDDVLSGFWSEAPLERRIVQHSYCLMGKGEHTIVDHVSTGDSDTAGGYTILRSKFDRWYLKKAQEAGATVVTKTNVTELLSSEDRIIGVRTDRGDLSADIVVVAEGANTMLCEKAGLIAKPRPDQMASSGEGDRGIAIGQDPRKVCTERRRGRSNPLHRCAVRGACRIWICVHEQGIALCRFRCDYLDYDEETDQTI